MKNLDYMKKNYKKFLFIFLGLAALITVIQVSSVLIIEAVQLNRNQKFVAKNYDDRGDSDTLVVYFSRSGNTELMAMEIAKAKGAKTVQLVAESYKIGFIGWVNALRDAGRKEASITPSSVDLSPYGTIYIGSPIWLYSPAPPIWEFVNNNDFSGKKVVLFNSMNSKFDQKYIDEFADLVRRRGGSFEAHIYIIRGRMTRQMDIDEFLTELRRLLERV
jgi:flavodoxin